MNIVKHGIAQCILFYNGTGVMGPEVTVYDSGVIHFKTPLEETTTHILMCEVVWFMVEEGPQPRLAEVKTLRGEGGEDGKSE